MLFRRWPKQISEKQKIEPLLDAKLLAGLRDKCKRMLAQELHYTPALHRTGLWIESPGWYQHDINFAWDAILSCSLS